MEQYRGKHLETPRFVTIFPDIADLWNLNTDISLTLDNDTKKCFYKSLKGPETLRSVDS